MVGCNQVFGVDETKLATRPDAIGCSGARFATTPEAYFDPPNDTLEQAVSPSELELIYFDFTLDRLMLTTRASATDPFGPSTPLAIAGTGDHSPSFTADGQRLVFTSNRLGTHQVYESIRLPSGEFGAPSPLGVAAKVATIAFDGLAIYWLEQPVGGGATTLLTATRETLEDPFAGNRILYTGYDNRWMEVPSLSPDQREVYFHDVLMQNQVLRLTRPSTDAEFDSTITPEVLLPGAYPYVAATGELLLVNSLGMIYALRRTCG